MVQWGILVPIFGIFCGIILGSLGIYYGTRKDILLIEKGLYKPLPVTQKVLMAGLVLTGIGTAIFLGIYWEIGLGAWSMAELIPCFIGIALLTSYVFIREST